MKKILMGALFTVALSTVGSAATLDFVSLGNLQCGAAASCSGGGGAISFTNNGATLTLSYGANLETGLNVPLQPGFSSTNYGLVSVSCTVCAGLTASFNLTGATIGLGVTQLNNQPFNATNAAMFVGTFSGSLTVTGGTSFGGNATAAFTPLTNSLTDGTTTINYYLQQPVNPPAPPGGYFLSINNSTTFQGAVDMTINQNPIPEPSTFALMGLALAGLGLLRRRS